MKFLTICTMKDVFSGFPPAIQEQLMEATSAWMDEQKKKGKVLEAYLSPGGTCIVISEEASAEEIVQDQAAIPMGGLMDFKVYPLADMKKSMQAYIAACKQAVKMFPSATK